ncbi:MAG: DUF6476 family protein [Amaricoccus sp.]|uniref:DUF6476 family protein n=1 Tax=Amaricoccus sp. TaxID=1872485 RepID=UPI0039E4BB9E
MRGDAALEESPEPPRLRLLRRMVLALTATLIAGVIAIVLLLVIRLQAAPAPVALPAEVRLPAGESARAVTLGSDWVAVVTVDGAGQERIRVLDRTSGAERAAVEIRAGK